MIPARAAHADASVAQRDRISTRVGSLAVRTRGAGPPAVLWHSLFVDDRSWARVEAALARDRRLVIITGPGHGASRDPGRRYTLDDCAAAACEVLATLGVEGPVDWVGNAWGGHVGIVFAATWPDRCRSLATFGTPIEPYGRSERVLFRILLGIYRAIGMVGYLSRGISDALLSPTTRAEDPEAVALVLDSLRTMQRSALANAMTWISLGRPDLTPRLAAIRCPTVFVTGSDHPEWTPERATAASERLAEGSVQVIRDTAYLIPLEAPAATIRILRDLWYRCANNERTRRLGHMSDDGAWEAAMIEDMRAHGGQVTQGPLAGHPLLIMTSTGAKSGAPRRAILTYHEDRGDLIVAGTAGGSATAPSWIHNVAADPTIHVEADGQTFPATATVIDGGPERDRLWDDHVVALPWFADYPEQSGRVIPMVRIRRAA